MRLAEVSTNGGYQGTVNCTILTIRSANGMRMNQLSLFGAIFLLKQVAISVTFSLTKPIPRQMRSSLQNAAELFLEIQIQTIIFISPKRNYSVMFAF